MDEQAILSAATAGAWDKSRHRLSRTYGSPSGIVYADKSYWRMVDKLTVHRSIDPDEAYSYPLCSAVAVVGTRLRMLVNPYHPFIQQVGLIKFAVLNCIRHGKLTAHSAFRVMGGGAHGSASNHRNLFLDFEHGETQKAFGMARNSCPLRGCVGTRSFFRWVVVDVDVARLQKGFFRGLCGSFQWWRA